MALIAGPEYSVTESLTIWRVITSQGDDSGSNVQVQDSTTGAAADLENGDANLVGKVGPVDVGGIYDAEEVSRMVPEF